MNHTDQVRSVAMAAMGNIQPRGLREAHQERFQEELAELEKQIKAIEERLMHAEQILREGNCMEWCETCGGYTGGEYYETHRATSSQPSEGGYGCEVCGEERG